MFKKEWNNTDIDKEQLELCKELCQTRGSDYFYPLFNQTIIPYHYQLLNGCCTILVKNVIQEAEFTAKVVVSRTRKKD